MRRVWCQACILRKPALLFSKYVSTFSQASSYLFLFITLRSCTMSRLLDRRSFIKAGALLGLTPLVPRGISAHAFSDKFFLPAAAGNPEVAIVKGADYYKATIKALDLLGGMKHFVTKNATVGLLINSRYDKPGTYVKPEIALAVYENVC